MDLRELFEGMAKIAFDPKEAEGWDTIIQYDITGEGGGKFYLNIKDQMCDVFEGEAENYNLKITADIGDWFAISKGELSGQEAFFSGKLKVEGDMNELFRMQPVFRTRS
ncbi:MAG: SCP2 sterol-binding domain-containing protein [Candidatus Methanofastidiosia archaeon]